MAAPSMLRDFTDEFGEILDRRRKDDAELRPTRVTARNADGTVTFRRMDGECIERGANCAVYVGQMVERPCRPAFSLQGSAGLAMKSAGRAIAALWVESLTPSALPRGFTGTVVIVGRGFRSFTVVEFLELDGETINADITITEIRYISATTLEVDVVVAADADIPIDPESLEPLPFPIAFDNPGTPL